MTGKKAGKAGRPRKPIGTIVRRTRWAEAQRVVCYAQWCEETEERFLDALATSCNVGAACEEAGVARVTVYRQRRNRADFALKWQAALEQGYARLELALVEAANCALSADEVPEGSPVAPMSADTALRVLQLHRASATGQGKRTGRHALPKRLEEVQNSILQRITAIQRHREGGGQGSKRP